MRLAGHVAPTEEKRNAYSV